MSHHVVSLLNERAIAAADGAVLASCPGVYWGFLLAGPTWPPDLFFARRVVAAGRPSLWADACEARGDALPRRVPRRATRRRISGRRLVFARDTATARADRGRASQARKRG